MRWKFIDQFRGFAILSMIFVNVCNEFDTSFSWFRHHTYSATFADFVAPAFIFIVGFSYRLSYTKNAQHLKKSELHKKIIKRYVIITFLGFIYGHFDFYVSVWDALTDIGIAGLLIYPFIGTSSTFILSAGFLYLLIYQLLFSLTHYGNWLMANSIDGGPLGPLSWVFILAWGSVCAIHFEKNKNVFPKTFSYWLLGGIILTLFGWILAHPISILPMSSLPFTQKGMTASYSLFFAGLCSTSLCTFYLINEKINIIVKPFTTMGKNSLVLYFLQAILIVILRLILPEYLYNYSMTPYIASIGILLLCFIVAKMLEIKSIYIKV
ncbi:MAG: heparan-alpha-glucosaminide N-acetyltransferase domain-containing protein [Candidatus Hydrogenedens sp.]|nr:heparan-alpha-glucosaminide N-acetyltransferase domain-containing protein [Candidatus Hydrogenedens sp.]